MWMIGMSVLTNPVAKTDQLFTRPIIINFCLTSIELVKILRHLNKYFGKKTISRI